MFPILQNELKSLHNINNFKVINSQTINLWVLEVRLFLSYHGGIMFKKECSISILYFKSFLSFLRLENPDILNYALFNEYDDIEEFLNTKPYLVFIKKKEVKIFIRNRTLPKNFLYILLKNLTV